MLDPQFHSKSLCHTNPCLVFKYSTQVHPCYLWDPLGPLRASNSRSQIPNDMSFWSTEKVVKEIPQLSVFDERICPEHAIRAGIWISIIIIYIYNLNIVRSYSSGYKHYVYLYRST